MSLKENFPSIQNRMFTVSEYIKSHEARKFNTDEIYSHLSDKNQEFLSPVTEYFKTYLNCLKNINRWKEHVYQDIIPTLNDNDYIHTLEMLKISQDIKSLNLHSVNFDDIELTILIHDGGEIIVDDISSNHPPEMDELLHKIKDLEPRLFSPCVLKQLKEKNFFGIRGKIRNLYKRYESRHNNFSDTESHLVKLIDIIQGNSFGLKNVYSKNKLNQVYSENNIPINPDDFIINAINKEISQLKIVLNSLENPQEKFKIFLYYQNQQFIKYSNPEYGFQEIFNNFSPIVNSIGQTLPSF
jgi:5'-deoxynucleotidase YfbR-like HD superfamily hydrolase